MEDFVEHIGPDGLYGIQLDTINSLILSLLPSMDFEFQCFKEPGLIDVAEDIIVYMLRLLIQCLRRCCGLYIPYVCFVFQAHDPQILLLHIVCNSHEHACCVYSCCVCIALYHILWYTLLYFNRYLLRNSHQMLSISSPLQCVIQSLKVL